jgi:predicted TIM-barrel fold metal-dependent hydrolase
VSDHDINALNHAGVRGIHVDLESQNALPLDEILKLATRVHSLHQWHTEIHVRSSQLKDIRPLLYQLPSFSIDHMGICVEGLRELYNLVEQGARVKVSGFRQLEFNQDTLAQSLQEIYAINPNSLIFGSNLPESRDMRGAHESDIAFIQNLFSIDDAERIFYKNALQFYQIG